MMQLWSSGLIKAYTANEVTDTFVNCVNNKIDQ